MFPSQPSSLGGKRTTLLHSRPNMGAFPASSSTNHIVSRNSIESLNSGGPSINHSIASRTLPNKIPLNPELFKRPNSHVQGYQEAQNYSNPRERKYIHNPDQHMKGDSGEFSQRDVPFSASQFPSQPQHQQMSTQHQNIPNQHSHHQFNFQSSPHAQSSMQQPMYQQSQSNGHYSSHGQIGHSGGQMVQGGHQTVPGGHQTVPGGHQMVRGGGQNQGGHPGQQRDLNNSEEFDGDPFDETPVVQEPIQYYEEEISSNIAPTYNPGYVVKEPAPFQSFVNEQLESSSHLSDHHSRDRPREEHHSRLSGERRFHEERVGQHVLVPPMVPDHNSRSGHHESRSGHHHDSRHPETRHSETRHSESRHSETRHTEERQYEHQQEEKRHHQDRHSDDRAHRRGAAERGRHGHHSEDRGRHGHSSRYPEEGERYREERSRGGQVYQDSVQTMRGESPANSDTASPSTAAVQNILSSMKGLGGLTNPLLNKPNTSEESDVGASNLQVSELLRNHIREVAKQLIEENGLSGSLDLVGKTDQKSVSPLKITTTMKRSDSGKRSRSSSPRKRSSKDRRRSHSKERRSSRHRNRRQRSRSRDRESRRDKKPDLDNDTIKRIMTNKYPKLAATLKAGEKLVEEHHSSPIETMLTQQHGQIPVSIPTGALPPPTGAFPPAGALPPPPLLNYGGVPTTMYQQYASFPGPPRQFNMPPVPSIPSVSGVVSGYNPMLTSGGMLPLPTATAPEPPKLMTGPMPNREKRVGVDQGNLLRCTPCNLNFKTKKDEPQSGPLSPVEISITAPQPQLVTPPHVDRITQPGHVWVHTISGMHEIKESELGVLVSLKGLDLQENTAGIKRTVDILQFKWSFEVTSLASGWEDISENSNESLEMIKSLHKKTWEDSKAFLKKRGCSEVATLVREKELWDILQLIGDDVNGIINTLHSHGRPLPPQNPSYRWAIEEQRIAILQHLLPLQDLAYQVPPDKFKYLDKWGDDLQNIRHEMRKSIDVAQALIGNNFEGSTTWEEIQKLIQACLDTLDALKNMCFEESSAYMKKQKLQKDLVSRRVQIGNCFNQTRTDLVHFKEFAKEKMAEAAPFIHLHLLEFRRQKLIDLVQNIASL